MLKPLLSFLLVLCLIHFAKAQKHVNDTLIVDSNQVLHRVKPVNDTIMPQFKGGSWELRYFLAKNIQYPKAVIDNKISGRVTVSFTVETDGLLTNFKITRGMGYGCDEEVLRVMKKSPRWKPAYKNDLPIKVEYNIEVGFDKYSDKGLNYSNLILPTKDTLMVFLKFPYLVVTKSDSADYVMFVYPPDKSKKKLYRVKEFYANGKIKLAGQLQDGGYSTYLHGQCVEYYPTGVKKSVTIYNRGYKTGYEYKFYPNKRVYTEKYFGDDKIVEYITCKDSLGNNLTENGKGYWIVYDNDFKKQVFYGFVKNNKQEGDWVGWINDDVRINVNYLNGVRKTEATYYKIEDMFLTLDDIPMYNKSFNALNIFISQNVKYPKKARKQDVTGSVVVSVVVKPDGKFSELKVVKSLGYDCDEEAIRVIQSTAPWQPATFLKNPVKIIVPVFFYGNTYWGGRYIYVPPVGGGISTRNDGMPRFYD